MAAQRKTGHIRRLADPQKSTPSNQPSCLYRGVGGRSAVLCPLTMLT